MINKFISHTIFRDRYDCIIGYSGHEYDLEPTVIVVALGAKIMERHVTLDHNMWGSDLFASLEVHVMDMLCKRIKDIDVILGDSVKGFAKNEIEIRKNYVDISIGLYFDYLWRL